MMHVFESDEPLTRAVADWFAHTAQEAVQRQGRFTVALTGGNSPKDLYQLLTQEPYRQAVPWQQAFVFWGDERVVPNDDSRNNARMAFELLLNHVPVPRNQIHRMSGELPPEESARQYEELLKSHFAGQAPRFDLILLGMGDNGHTASLFPHQPVLHEKDRWVSSLFLPEQDMYRITLTAPLINQARQIGFQVFGENKAEMLHRVLEGPHDPNQLPSQLIQPVDGELHWFVDKAAASQLSNRAKTG